MPAKKSTKIFLGYKTLGSFYFLVSVVVVVVISSSLVVLPHKTILDMQSEDFVLNR